MMHGIETTEGELGGCVFHFSLEREREEPREEDRAAVIGRENRCYLLYSIKRILKRMFILWNVKQWIHK